MVLHLDPRFPMLWRSPFSVQFGADDPPVVFDEVTDSEERMLAALAVGVTRPGLDLIATSSGGTPASAGVLLAKLTPVLMAGRPTSASSVSIVGSGRTVELLAESLSAADVTVHLCGMDLARALEPVDLAVVVAHFVIEPELHGIWLRRDLPHLPLVLGDAAVTIGPVIEPGSGPCLYCLERTRTDARPWWPAVESQLWGRESPLDRGATAAQTAAIAARLAIARLGGRSRRLEAGSVREGSRLVGSAGSAVSVSLDAATGITTNRVHHRHPECGCSALPGTATGSSASIARAGRAPRRVAVGAAPG